MKKLIVFDLDGTLAESKSILDPETTTLLIRLLAIARVGVISGGSWAQFEKQLLSSLPHEDHLRNLSLLPTCGTKFYQYDSHWDLLYSEDLTGAEKEKIARALNLAATHSGITHEQTWGEVIEDRGSQITFSALGQQAPVEEKRKWDPGYTKRQRMEDELKQLIPEFAVHLGGMTSVDVTKPGIDKAYGIRKLRSILGIALQEMIFVGDALFPGGNDYPVKQAGVVSIQVRDTHETRRVIEAMIACLSHAPRNEAERKTM